MKLLIIVPAYNEEKFIAAVIDTVPSFVDKIYVVNDCSSDKTCSIVSNKARENSRIVLIDRNDRGGVGAAIITGHRRALQEGMDILAVMAGDGQMAPSFLENFVAPIAEGMAEYTKGNRLSSREHRKEMPVWRTFGNILLTNLTRIASGYYSVSDPQNGYTAISGETLKKLDLNRIEKGFAFENDMLVKLSCVGARVVDIPHPALYRGQNSKIRYSRFIVSTSWVLLKSYVWRIWIKHLTKSKNRV